MVVALTLAGLLGLQEPPPPYPVMPGRPPPIASGFAFGGVLGSACDDRRGDDGRWFNDHALSLGPGQSVGLNVSSREFAPLMQVIDADGGVVAGIGAAADGEAAGFVFTAPGERSREPQPSLGYRIRVTSAKPGAGGPWRVEQDFEGRIDVAYPGEASPFPVRTGCQPMPPLPPRAG
ncbi:hypothetical protein [Brevundimonas sp.]|uniref:hypothetical protein n=1 Tax=Brevundimonas sp. TaxID=1871086 RepID=UPI002CFE7D45|nr:hypothetical protein [Brevundimonas sp.]HWQ87855.1 hypothetical protein [Brevundimonas sp.]